MKGCIKILLFTLWSAMVFSSDLTGLAGPHRRNFTVLHRFSGGDGSEPVGSLVMDSQGNIFGATSTGGAANFGVIFELSQRDTPNKHWKETVLHEFNGADGANPIGGLTIDKNGDLFGTTFTDTNKFAGFVFELSTAGMGNWTFSQLYSFGSGSNGGSNPNGGLLLSASGDLYGTTQFGGRGNCYCGTVFEISKMKDGLWHESVLYSFPKKPHPAYPYGSVISDASGNFYGTTTQGGDGHCGDGDGDKAGCGTIFLLTPSHPRATASVLYNFQRHEQHGPAWPLALGPDGALYGTAGYDVFKLTPPGAQGDPWVKGLVHRFKEGIAGTIPSSGVTFDIDGNLYGTTSSSGVDGFGAAYELSPAPAGKGWKKLTLAKFAKSGFDEQPRGGLLKGPDGTLYGAVNGTPGYIFAVKQ